MRWHFQELGLSAFGFKDGGSSGWASCFGLSRRFGSLRRHCSKTRLVVFHDCAQGVGSRLGLRPVRELTRNGHPLLT